MQETVEITKITPELASKWLEANFKNNRQIRQARVDAYASDMAAGNWTFTGEAVKFSIDGSLIDGQHRLSAIVASGKSIKMLIVKGVKPAAMTAMDTQMGRTLSNVLAIQSYENPGSLASAIAAAHTYESYMKDKVTQDSATILQRDGHDRSNYRRFSGDPFTRTDAMALLKRRPTLVTSVETMKPHCHGRPTQLVTPPVSTVTLMHNIAQHGEGGASVIEFVEAVREGAGAVSDTVYQLNKMMQRARADKHYLTAETRAVLWMRGYEQYLSDDSTELRRPKGRSFPTIPGDVDWYINK